MSSPSFASGTRCAQFASALLTVCLGAAAAAQDVIVVTTDRRGEARDAAVQPVSVISGADIAFVGAQHPAELLNREAGVFIHRGNGAEHLTAIRSPVLTGGDGAGSFLYLEDGIPLRSAGFANVNGLFEDIGNLAASVEVLRGPGPALYGSNALHGLVNTRTPDPGEAATRLGISAGSFGRLAGQGQWVRQGEDRAALLAVSGRREDGWRDEAGLDHVAALVRFDGRGGTVDWRFTAALIGLNQETAGFITGARAYEDRALARQNADPQAFRDAIATRMALRLDGAISERWSWSLIPFARANEMDFLMHFFPSDPLEESGHASAGLMSALVRETDGLRLTLGADLERTSGWLRETQERPTLFSFVQGDHYDYTVEADTLALYAQGRWQAGGRLSVQAGARYERTGYEYDNHLPPGTVGRYLRLSDRSDAYETFTPHIGFVWEVADNSAIFGRLARGARAPQTAELYRLQPGQEIAGIEPVTLDSAELGWRTRLGTRGRIELVGFAMEKSNVFFRDADGFNVTDAATRHRGVELDVEYDLTQTLSLALTGTHARHTYAFDRPVSVEGETVRSGDDVDTAPRWLWTGRATWRPTPDWRLALEWSHVGEYFTDAANAHAYPGHDVLRLSVDRRLGEGLHVYGHVRNLTDAAYAERADFAFGNERYFPGEPRNVTIGIRMMR